MVPGWVPVSGFAVLRPHPRRSNVTTRYPPSTKPGILYCQLSALPVFACSNIIGTALRPVSVYQRRTPGRPAYPANPGIAGCAVDAINGRKRDPYQIFGADPTLK